MLVSPKINQWIKETERCLSSEPGCRPDTQKIINRIKTCLADGSCKHDVYELFQKEKEDKRKAELIEKYVKNGPPACFASGACSPDIADLVKKAEQTRKIAIEEKP
jgi:ferredoxin